MNGKETEMLKNIMFYNGTLPKTIAREIDNKHSYFFKKFMEKLSEELKSKTPVN